jgi:proteasome lid subunit RPN8/RPN11
MFSKLNFELQKDLAEAKKQYPLDFASEVQMRIGSTILKQIWNEVEAALSDRRERVWVILNRFEPLGSGLILTAKEMITFQELQRHVGGDMKRNGSSIDSRKILFYFEHLPLEGIWTLVHSHVDGPPYPTGPDISYLPLGWMGLTASVYKDRYYIIPFRSDSFEYKGTPPSKKYFQNFVLDIKGSLHQGWFEEDSTPKNAGVAATQ